MEEIKKLQDFIASGEEIIVKVGDFEFLLFEIEKDYNNHYYFKFKTYSPKDHSFALKCLEGKVYDEIIPYLKYFNIDKDDVYIVIQLYEKDKLLNDGRWYHFTQEFLDNAFDVIKDEKRFIYDGCQEYDTKRKFTLDIKQEPIKVIIESNGEEDYLVSVESLLLSAKKIYDDTKEEVDVTYEAYDMWPQYVEEYLDFQELWREVPEFTHLFFYSPYLDCAYPDFFSNYVLQ